MALLLMPISLKRGKMESAQGRGKGGGTDESARGKRKQEANKYEQMCDAIVAENNEKLAALKQMRAAVVAGNKEKMASQNLQRPSKTQKTHGCTNTPTNENHNLRRSRRLNTENEEEHAQEDPNYKPDQDILDENEVGDLTIEPKQKRKGRGITRKAHMQPRVNQPKIKITINEYDQPVGFDSKDFASMVGTTVRRVVHVNCDDWRNVDVNKKLEVWSELKLMTWVKKLYTNRKLMETAWTKWKGFKSDLKRRFFDPTLTEEELFARCETEKRLNAECWKWLINYWMSPESEVRSAIGKMNRGKLRMLHTSGSKSHARVAYDMTVEQGRPARRDEVWIATHLHKNGVPTIQAASTVRELKAAAENHPELMERTIQEGDLFASVCGEKEPRGRVRCLGLGPTPQDVGTPGTQSKMPTRLQIEIACHQQTKRILHL